MSNRSVRNNERSLLLSDQENESIFNVLGKGCQSLSTAVVQLFLSEGANNQLWNKKSCGVVCFVKDNSKRSFFIRLYDPLTNQKIWEQELYMHFRYKTPKEFFHTFEADDCQAGLNFASVDEADNFQKVVQGKLLDRQKRRTDRNKQQGRIRNEGLKMNDVKEPVPTITVGETSLYKANENTVRDTKVKDKRKGKGKKKITKADISSPTQFRHVGHVGWDPESGLQTEKLDPEMKALFEEIGLNDHSQVDEDTIDFIYDFVGKHGGLQALREDLARRKPPAVPPSSTDLGHAHIGKATHLPARPKFAAPDPPDSNQAPSLPQRPARPTMVPPPTPSRDRQNSGGTESSIPQSPPLNIPDAPPLPPPAPNMPPPPPLKKTADISSPPPSSGRAGLLDAIVNFKSSTLSRVRSEENAEKPAPSSVESGGIAAALMDALNKRKPAMQFSDDEDGSSDDMDDDDDDEWDE